MKGIRVCLAAVGCFLALVAPGAPVAGQSDDEVAVREAVELYMQSHATGDGQYVAQVFHPELTMFYVRDGEVRSRAGTDYIGGFRGQPPADDGRRRWIEMVDVSGGAAVAKVILDFPDTVITDYFTLLKVEGEWKIMNKVFHAAPK